MMRRLSIITINRNNAEGLRKTIGSVICQTLNDYEFIVIDGASDDNSVEIIKENVDHLTYWVSQPDKGIYDAMNKGIRAAGGEYCLFLNSGDYLTDCFILEKLFDTLPEADIISGNVLKIRSNNKYRRVTSPETVSLHKLCIHSLPHQSTLIRRILFQEIGFYTDSYRIASDWEFFLKAIVIGGKSYRHVDLDISFFRIGGVSSSSENFSLSRDESFEILKRHFPGMADDLMEYRNFYNSNLGQIISLLKKKKGLYTFIDNFFGVILRSKKKIAGR